MDLSLVCASCLQVWFHLELRRPIAIVLLMLPSYGLSRRRYSHPFGECVRVRVYPYAYVYTSVALPWSLIFLDCKSWEETAVVLSHDALVELVMSSTLSWFIGRNIDADATVIHLLGERCRCTAGEGAPLEKPRNCFLTFRYSGFYCGCVAFYICRHCTQYFYSSVYISMLLYHFSVFLLLDGRSI